MEAATDGRSHTSKDIKGMKFIGQKRMKWNKKFVGERNNASNDCGIIAASRMRRHRQLERIIKYEILERY